MGLFGDRVHVVSIEPERTSAAAEAALRQAGLGIVGIGPIEPSLAGIPFFYWYQMAWIFLGSLCLLPVYLFEERQGR